MRTYTHHHVKKDDRFTMDNHLKEGEFGGDSFIIIESGFINMYFTTDETAALDSLIEAATEARDALREKKKL